MRWTVRRLDVRCGAAVGCRIPAGDPVAEYCGGRLTRCATHAAALGDAVDETEVELERYRLAADVAAAEQARRDHTPTPPVRYRRPRRLVSADVAAVAVRQARLFDPRAAQVADADSQE
jgi:hypothetical protein